MAIFNSYVSLPEGIPIGFSNFRMPLSGQPLLLKELIIHLDFAAIDVLGEKRHAHTATSMIIRAYMLYILFYVYIYIYMHI